MDAQDDPQLFSPLFMRKRAEPVAELCRLIEWIRRSFEEDIDAFIEDIYFALYCAPFHDVAVRVRAGTMPPAALQGIVALTACTLPNESKTLRTAAMSVWSLADHTIKPTSVESAFGDSTHARYPPVIDPWGRYIDRPTDREAPGAPSPPHLVELVDRLLPLTLGGNRFKSHRRDRPVAWFNRHLSPSWAALAAVFDVFAGSRAALERLRDLGAEALRRPRPELEVLWLVEAGHRVVGEDARAAPFAERIDNILAAPPYPPRAAELTAIEVRRENLAALNPKLSDAILAVGAMPRRQRPKSRDITGPSTPEWIELLKTGAEGGNPLAAAFLELEAGLDADSVEVEFERESDGPYHCCFPKGKVKRRIDKGIAEVMFGHRCVSGMEHLVVAYAELVAWRDAISA